MQPTIYQKTSRVIDSCENYAQVKTAYRYAVLASERMIKAQSLNVFGRLMDKRNSVPKINRPWNKNQCKRYFK